MYFGGGQDTGYWMPKTNPQRPKTKDQRPKTGYWILDTGCCDTGCWILDTVILDAVILDAGYCDTGYQRPKTGYWIHTGWTNQTPLFLKREGPGVS